MPWFERARGRLGQEWRVEHEVLEADDRRVAAANQPADVRAREAAPDDEHVPLFYALLHGASLRDRERYGARGPRRAGGSSARRAWRDRRHRRARRGDGCGSPGCEERRWDNDWDSSRRDAGGWERVGRPRRRDGDRTRS